MVKKLKADIYISFGHLLLVTFLLFMISGTSVIYTFTYRLQTKKKKSYRAKTIKYVSGRSAVPHQIRLEVSFRAKGANLMPCRPAGPGTNWGRGPPAARAVFVIGRIVTHLRRDRICTGLWGRALCACPWTIAVVVQMSDQTFVDVFRLSGPDVSESTWVKKRTSSHLPPRPFQLSAGVKTRTHFNALL